MKIVQEKSANIASKFYRRTLTIVHSAVQRKNNIKGFPMKMTFRWYGPSDPVLLDYIRQIPNVTGVVTAVYDVPAGEVWPRESIAKLKTDAAAYGLEFEVVESVPVHEDIKLGRPSRDVLIANYCENIRRLGEAGVRVICYNFMPVFDWTRTTLQHVWPDGSNSLAYYKADLSGLDPLSGELSLPGWDSSYKKDELRELFDAYKSVDGERLFEHLGYFLDRVIPVARESGVFMAIHPDDPPYPIFGLPRIITDERNIERFLKLYDDPHNGLTFCTGSLGCSNKNDIYTMLDRFIAAGRVHFVHARNVKLYTDDSFEETAHFAACGSLDLVKVMKLLKKHDYTGYVRPDHGRMIWDETGKPGYGLYDRALGAMYLGGIWDGISTNN